MRHYAISTRNVCRAAQTGNSTDKALGRWAVKLFKPKYRLGHPENYLVYCQKSIYRIKVSKKRWISCWKKIHWRWATKKTWHERSVTTRQTLEPCGGKTDQNPPLHKPEVKLVIQRLSARKVPTIWKGKTNRMVQMEYNLSTHAIMPHTCVKLTQVRTKQNDKACKSIAVTEGSYSGSVV